MATSLSEQLKRLALPQTSLLQRDKKRPSLLFDPKEAAGLKRETVYQIGLDGLQELISKDQAFEEFKNSLFHLTSKKFERAMQTAESNKKLNKVIRKFFLQLSPYFLLNSSHKALEWLVNRYSIHEYNRDDLLMLVLPYHESNIFVRVIQLMKFNDQNDNWFFLKSLQKTGVHLTKQALLTRASSDVYLLKFVGKFITLLIKQFEKPNLLTVAFNFYCTIFAGAVEYSHELNEAQITQMLPTLIKGLNSDIPDYCAASYIILGRLVMKTSLTDVILNKFVEKISEVNVETLKTENALLLLVLYQSQNHYTVVTEEACMNFIARDWLPKVLQDLNSGKYYVTPFLTALIKACFHGAVKLDQEEHREFMKKLLAAIKFEDSFIETVLSLLLDTIKDMKLYPKHTKKWVTEIIETLERQYPSQFDKEVYKILSTTRGKMMRRKSLQNILKESMTTRCKFEVIDKLYHPIGAFRAQAISFLTENYESLRDREKEMIKSSFIDRLNDDDVAVVGETLNLIKSVRFLKVAELREVLIKLAYKCQKDLRTWEPVSTEIVLMLCKNSTPNDLEVFVAAFPYVLPSSEKQLEAARRIIDISFFKRSPLLKNIKEEIEEHELFCNNIFDNLRTSPELVRDFLDNLKRTPLEERCTLNKYLVTVILSCILPKDSPVETSAEVVSTFLSFFESCKVKYEKGNALFQRHMDCARREQFHIEAFLLCANSVILKTKKPQVNVSGLDFHDENDFKRYFVSLADALFRNTENHKKYSLFFVNHFCEGLNDKLVFVLNLAISGRCRNPDFPSECVSLITRLLETRHKTIKHKALLANGLLPYILAMLVHKSEDAKSKMFEVVETLSGLRQEATYSRLLRVLLEQREEIIADNDQLPLILFNYLLSSVGKVNKVSQKADDLKDTLIKASCTEDHPIYLKANVLEILSHINSIEIFEQTSQDCLNYLTTESTSLGEAQSAIVLRNVMRCQVNIAKDIRVDTSVWRLIQTCLKRDDVTLICDGTTSFVTVLLLEQFNKEFFAQLEEEVQMRLLDLIVETATVTKNPEVLPAVRRIIRVIDLDAKSILTHFSAMRDVQSPKLDQTKLKRRISVVPTIDILDTLEWRKGLTALEFIQDKKKIRNVEALLPVLFDILKKCLDFDEQAAVEYPKQLILSSILDLGKRTERDNLTETMFNMELIVQCIRASQNPQTHYCALLVLAFSADLFPTQVLHNIMAIFTFMGSSLLRHEDAYSFQIIAKIIDTIIPILVKDSDPETIAKVLRVFVDVLLDVPEHRRMPIYEQLLNKIGVTDHLYIFLLLIFESHVNHSGTNTKNKDDDMKRLEIAASICREFPPKIVIQSCINLTKYLKELPDETESENTASAFDILCKTPKQFRHYKYTLIVFTAKLLASKEFVIQVASLTNEDLQELEPLYKDMIINILTYVHRISKIAEKNATSPQAKYWKVILHLSYDILDSVNAILTPQMFLLVVKGLMLHNFNTVKRRSMELLNSKLQNAPTFFDDCASEEIYSLVPPLLSIIKNIEEPQVGSEGDLIVQTALLSLKLLVKLLVKEYSDKLTEILDFLTDLTKSGKAQNNVLASLLLCLAELCANLRAHAIPSLPYFMPALLKILKQQKSQESSSLLLLSSVTAVQKILETLPLFLSPYLERLLYELSLLTSRCSDDAEDKLQPVVNKLSTVRQQIGTSIPPRVLIPVLGQSYSLLISKGAFNAVAFLMEVLGENLNHLNGSEINANLPELTNFFLNALQFRTDQDTTFEQANEVEAQIVKALTKLILKLSESTFKPLYYKLFDWAARHEQKTERLITFYALSSEIAESLKSLFVFFAGHFLNNASQVLDGCNVIKTESLYFENEKKTVLLLENILKTLHSVFLYDNHKFINKDRFQVLMQPLVDQLENELPDVEGLKRRNEELVTPVIVQFAVATADDSLWKQLNYQILLKMKHSSANIRLISLHCLKEMVKRLGVDYLPLLPETIPVLAELLEDEEEAVEKACRGAVQEMEKILGEPIEKYFKM